MADIRRIVLEVHGLVGDRTAKIVEDFYPEAEVRTSWYNYVPDVHS